MELNPEFRRNLWLEMTPHRLLVMPLILIAVAFLIFKVSGEGEGLVNLNAYALFALGFMIIFWGARMASESLVAEVNGRTWDSQRMSSLGPWSMTWGKLLGSTAYVWYGALFCVVIFLATYGSSTLESPVRSLIFLLLTGLFSQSLSLLSSIVMLKKSRDDGAGQSARAVYLVVAIFVSSFVVPIGFNSSLRPESLLWFGMYFVQIDFVILSILIFLGWSVFGVHRLMATELQVRTTFFGWLGFVVFAVTYTVGFFTDSTVSGELFDGFSNERLTVFMVGYTVALCLAYLMLFSEKKDLVLFRQIVKFIKERNLRELFLLLPCWAVSAIVVALIAVVGEVTVGDMPRGALIALFLFFIRDLSLVLFLNLSKNKKRADMTAGLYLILLYGVVPWIFKAIDLDFMTALFWANVQEYGFGVHMAVTLEIIAIVFLLNRRWKKVCAEPVVVEREG
ncbi:MAG: hypothetical protein KAT46_00150 [Deltaproteobacteria bacterium]|nr:hypothetical protein [Deltaproteobacteria bacterium]